MWGKISSCRFGSHIGKMEILPPRHLLTPASAERAAVGLVAPYLLAVAIDLDEAVIDAAGHQGIAVGQAGDGDRAIDAGLPELVAFPVELDDGLLVVQGHENAAIGQDLDVAAQSIDGTPHVKAFQFASLRVKELAASAGGGDGELAVAQALGRRDIA